MQRAGYVYIMASKRNGTLYLGVTSDLIKRVREHRNGVGSVFTNAHNCHLLVWYEVFQDIQSARHRELPMKKWKRAWKLRVIEVGNPDWNDLFESIC